MINLIGLCHYLRKNYPIPAPPSEINISVLKYLGHEVPQDAQMDIVKSLSTMWKRGGWFWTEKGAVKLEEGESAAFHDKGVSLIREHEFSPNHVRIKLIERDSKNPRVVWF